MWICPQFKIQNTSTHITKPFKKSGMPQPQWLVQTDRPGNFRKMSQTNS